MNTVDGGQSTRLVSLPHRYLLVLHIPVHRKADGSRWTDPLWARDLLRHVDYLGDFTLACPCTGDPPPEDLVRVDDPRIKFVDLPARRKATLGLPRMVWELWRSVGQAEVVHTGLGGWLPVSLCNLTILIARLRRRYLFIMVESSSWRLVPGQPASWLARLQASAAEWMNRRSLARVDLAFFTQEQYQATLMPDRAERGHIIHASWIDKEDIISEERALGEWSSKRPADGKPIRVLFAGRLTAAKGIPVLLDALRQLDQKHRCAIDIHVIGTGELRDACLDVSRLVKHVSLKLLEPVAYGAPFFDLVRSYDAVLVPSVTDEQPRIVYDAYSQAVPVLASDTGGLRDCIQEGSTGRLFAANDATALCNSLQWAAAHPQSLQDMGMNALQKARSMTHQIMHRRRWALLQQHLPPHRH